MALCISVLPRLQKNIRYALHRNYSSPLFISGNFQDCFAFFPKKWNNVRKKIAICLRYDYSTLFAENAQDDNILRVQHVCNLKHYAYLVNVNW